MVPIEIQSDSKIPNHGALLLFTLCTFGHEKPSTDYQEGTCEHKEQKPTQISSKKEGGAFESSWGTSWSLITGTSVWPVRAGSCQAFTASEVEVGFLQ